MLGCLNKINVIHKKSKDKFAEAWTLVSAHLCTAAVNGVIVTVGQDRGGMALCLKPALKAQSCSSESIEEANKGMGVKSI